ncbi:hypothetical protein DIPPA_14693 [Diplonema papillatum]|nr:hypothetical protein DIPPA_14693 [Diplonema papillatum]
MSDALRSKIDDLCERLTALAGGWERQQNTAAAALKAVCDARGRELYAQAHWGALESLEADLDLRSAFALKLGAQQRLLAGRCSAILSDMAASLQDLHEASAWVDDASHELCESSDGEWPLPVVAMALLSASEALQAVISAYEDDLACKELISSNLAQPGENAPHRAEQLRILLHGFTSQALVPAGVVKTAVERLSATTVLL